MCEVLFLCCKRWYIDVFHLISKSQRVCNAILLIEVFVC